MASSRVLLTKQLPGRYPDLPGPQAPGLWRNLALIVIPLPLLPARAQWQRPPSLRLLPRLRACLIPVLCTLLALDCYGEAEKERSRLEALKSRISELKEALNYRISEIDNLEDDLRERELAAQALRERTRTLDGEIETLENELKTLEARRQVLEQHSIDQQAMIAREMNAAYRLGQSEPIKLLLNQDDPYKLARILKYYQYFANARQEKIQQFQKTIAELATLSDDIAGKQDDLISAREENSIKLAELNLEREKRQQVINNLNKALEDDNARLAKLNRERSELEDLIASLEEEIQKLAPEASEPFAEARGKLPWPTRGTLSKGFGSRRSQNMSWRGWLIDTSAGEAVTAVHNGRIVYSDYFRGHGLMVIVDHGNGYLSLYAHNQLLLKDVGDWVKRGDTIAQAGATGGLAESALYFEIRHNGKPQDPKRWLQTQG